MLNIFGRLFGHKHSEETAPVREEKSFLPVQPAPIPTAEPRVEPAHTAEVIPLKRERPSRAKPAPDLDVEAAMSVLRDISPAARNLVLHVRYIGKTVWEIDGDKLVTSPLSIKRDVLDNWREPLDMLVAVKAIEADIDPDRVVICATDLTHRLKAAWEAEPHDDEPTKQPPAPRPKTGSNRAR